MHVRELVEVAGLVASNGPLLVAAAPQKSSVYLEQYWATCRCRFESWNRALKGRATSLHDDPREESDKWVEVRAVLDEIFTSEMLTRVWTAVLVARDRHWRSDAAEPLARNVLAAHMESRQRALGILLDAESCSPAQAVALNRLRRRTERWTDVLLGGLLNLWDVLEFAIEPQRAADFATDLARQRSHPGGQQAWQLTLISLRNAFQTGLSPVAANPDTNARITASILGCFEGELFDSTGIFKSLWLLRLSANASDAQGMISDLLRSSPHSNDPAPTGRSPRRRI